MQRSQKGFTLIELILVLALMSFIALLNFLEKQTDFEQARARAVGGLIFQYNNAVRSALAQDLSTVTSGTYQGSGWLKSSSCGGQRTPGKELLPCDFPMATSISPIPFGRLEFTTNVVVTGTSPNLKFTATTSTSPFIVGEIGDNFKVRADLAGIAVLAAASAMNSGYQSAAGGGITPYSATTDARYNSEPLTARMTFVASNNAYNDVWLRTDGSNRMHASLQFDGASPSDRSIIGASSIQNLAGQAIRIGNGSMLTPATSYGVIVGAGAEVLGDFRVRNTVTVDGAASFQSGVSVAGNVSATGRVTGDTIYGKRFVDTENTSYWIDPNSASVFNSIFASGVTVTGNVTVSNMVAANNFLGKIFVDQDDLNYYVKPNATTSLHTVTSKTLTTQGRITAGELVEIKGVANSGAPCSPNGLVGREADGSILSCVSGAWKGAGGLSGPYAVSGTYLGNWTICTLNYTSGNSKRLSYNGSQWVWNGDGTQLIYCYL